MDTGLSHGTAVTYGGRERRNSPRIRAQYPVRLQLHHSGSCSEWFSHTSNVSSEGLLVALSESLEPGIEVNVSLAIPVGSSSSLPAAQLDGSAVVLRSEAADRTRNDGYSQKVALRFLEKPAVSTGVSMFD